MSCCGVTIEAHRNADKRITYTPRGRSFSFSALTALLSIRRGGDTILQVTNAPTGNGSSFVAIESSLVLTLKKADIVSLSIVDPDKTEILSYDVVLTGGSGLQDWAWGGDFVVLGLNEESCAGSEDISVSVNGEVVDVSVEAGSIGVDASVLLDQLNEAVNTAEAAADAAIAATSGKADTNLGNTAVAIRPGDAGESASSLFRRKYRTYFDPTDPQWGAVPGGKTGDATADLATAQANRVAMQACANAFIAAVNSGIRRATFYLPNRDFLIASAPYIGSSPGSVGVSATGGGHYRGVSSLPLSSGWSCHCLVFDGLTGGNLVSDGGRLIRVENDPYNTSSSADDTNSAVLIVRSSGFVMDGVWDHEGYQNDSPIAATAPTSGAFVDISYGCKQFSSIGLIKSWKHTNALTVGMNRNTAFGGGGYDILQPCTEWDVADIEAYVGNHAIFINVADQWSISSVRHGFKPYTYGGITQGDYVQRSVYLLSCGTGEIGRIQSNVGQKAQILLTAYPSTRAYKDLDVTIGVVDLTAKLNQDADFNSGVEINDQNDNIATLRRISATIGTLRTRGHKIGLNYRDDGATAVTGTSVLNRLIVDNIDIKATGVGVNLIPNGGASNIKIGKGFVDVRADPAYSATVPSAGVKIASIKGFADGALATDFINNLTIGQLDVVSGNRTCLLQSINGLSIGGATFIYQDQSVPGAQTYDLRLDYGKTYGTIDYRLGAGGLATQSLVNEIMPTPVKGRFVRSQSRDPGVIAAGASQTSAVTVTGARPGMTVVVEITTPPAGVIATGTIASNDAVNVTTRNVGTAATVAGALNYIISVFSV